MCNLASRQSCSLRVFASRDPRISRHAPILFPAVCKRTAVGEGPARAGIWKCRLGVHLRPLQGAGYSQENPSLLSQGSVRQHCNIRRQAHPLHYQGENNEREAVSAAQLAAALPPLASRQDRTVKNHPTVFEGPATVL